MGRRLSAREPPEYGSDRHAKSAEIALGENISGHDLSRRENIWKWFSMLIDDARAIINFNAHVCERDTRPQRQRVERRPFDGYSPIAFRRREPARAVSAQLVHAQVGVPRRR